MRGKNKCKILKQIRQKIADENDIPLLTKECTYQGECSGTCPRCEAELQYLEQQLARRQALGKAVTVAALSVGLMSGLSGCTQTPELVGAVEAVQESMEPTSQSSTPQSSTSESFGSDTLGLIIPPDTEADTEIVELDGDVAYVPDETDTYVTAGAPTAGDLVDFSDFTEATTEPNE